MNLNMTFHGPLDHVLLADTHKVKKRNHVVIINFIEITLNTYFPDLDIY